MRYLYSFVFLCVIAVAFSTYSLNTEKFGNVNDGITQNPSLTPGALNLSITQATIAQTICNPSWSTKSIRPSSAYTTALKKKQMNQYGYKDMNTADYEEDHLISLELGGNPTDPKNLWPQSYQTTPNAKDKDRVENLLHKEVCDGTITLIEAQKQILTWTKVYAATKGKFGSTEINTEDDI